MKEYLQKEIIEQSRHQFIYGYNGEKRKQFLKELPELYPIKINQSSPMAIYLDEFSLPYDNKKNNTLDKSLLATISEEYLNFSISYNILLQIYKQINSSILDNQINLLLDRVNRLYLNKDLNKISNIEELLESLKKSRTFYSKYYYQYINNECDLPRIKDSQIPFIEINSYLNYIKKMLNNDSHFAIIIDHQFNIPNISVQAINGIISRRCNSDLSMKVACEINNWPTYHSLSGTYIERIHDYGVIELDNSYQKQTNLKTKKLNK